MEYLSCKVLFLKFYDRLFLEYVLRRKIHVWNRKFQKK